jgi:general secretion pathway protein L
MLKTLFIRPHPFEQGLVEWGVIEEDHFIARSQGYVSSEALPAEGEFYERVCLAPAARFFVTGVQLPNVNPRVLKRALPYAIEEKVAVDIESQHLTIVGKPSKTGFVVSAVEHELMQQWTAMGQAVWGPLTHLVPEALCVPYQENTWSLLVEEDHVFVRTDAYHFIYSERENVVHILDALYHETEHKPALIKIYLADPDGEKLLVASLENHLAMDSATAIEVQSYDDSFLFLAQHFAQQDLENHLQGSYRPTIKHEKKQSPWSLPIAIAGVWAVLGIGHNSYHATVINQQANVVKKASRDLYRELFPSTNRVPRGIRRDMQSKLVDSNDNIASFVTTLVGVGGVKQSADFSKMAIKSIRYNENRGGLLLEMNGDSVETFEQFKTALIKVGLNAELASVSSQEGTVFGRVKVGGSNG